MPCYDHSDENSIGIADYCVAERRARAVIVF